MKICVVGPINTDTYFGGVSVFTESLASSFSELGNEVSILTDYVANREIKNVEIISLSSKPSRKNIYKMMKIKKLLNELKPDLVISSLEYSLFIPKKTEYEKVHFIHGFPTIRHYGFIKTSIMCLVDKTISSKFQYKICNSNFTKVINEEIFNNKITNVVNIGVSKDFVSSIADIECRKNKNILFVGRLVSAKNVEVLLFAYKNLIESYDANFTLTIVGDGPDLERLKSLAIKNHLKVNFTGKVSQAEAMQYYQEAEIFVSLNSHEPFGMVFVEALTNGCKIVAPNTGGQIDFLGSYMDRVKFVNSSNKNEISDAIFELSKISPDVLSKEVLKKKFDYQNVATTIMQIVNKKPITVSYEKLEL